MRAFYTSSTLFPDIYPVNLILIYTSNAFPSITYIKQVKSFNVNYLADVPPKIFLISWNVYFLSFRQNTLNASPSQSKRSFILNVHMYVIYPTQ